MSKHSTTSHGVTGWLLVLALVFAPLQNLLAEYNQGCRHAEAAETAMSGCPDHMASDQVAVSAAIQNSCEQDCCAGTCPCKVVHGSSALVTPAPAMPDDFRSILEPRQRIHRIGRTVPPVLQPPRS